MTRTFGSSGSKTERNSTTLESCDKERGRPPNETYDLTGRIQQMQTNQSGSVASNALADPKGQPLRRYARLVMHIVLDNSKMSIICTTIF
jgi:hypothetical protein